MTVELAHYINGIQLDTENCHVQAGGTFLGDLSTRRSATGVASRHGVIPSVNPPLFDERQYTLRLRAFGETAARDMQRIALLCTMPRITIGRRIGDGPMQECRAELVSLSEGDVDLPHNADMTIVFALPEVWWRSQEYMLRQVDDNGGIILPPTGPVNNESGYQTMWLGLPDASESLLWDDMPEGYFSDAPVTDVQIRLPRGCTSATITDNASSTGITWAGTADNAKYTYLSAATLSAYRASSSSEWDTGGTAIAGVDYPAGGPLALYPLNDGSYRITYETTGGDASADPVVLRFRQAWW